MSFLIITVNPFAYTLALGPESRELVVEVYPFVMGQPFRRSVFLLEIQRAVLSCCMLAIGIVSFYAINLGCNTVLKYSKMWDCHAEIGNKYVMLTNFS